VLVSRKTHRGDDLSENWPAGGLEPVGKCPNCGCNRRTKLHDGLADDAFGVASGRWLMQHCDNCRCGYLDPRPTQETIGLAYANYYTHQEGRAGEGALARLRRQVALSYVNRRYGTRFPEALKGAHVVAWLLPRRRRFLDVSYTRHLRRAGTGGRRLLDVGCGNGEFLACATALGWDAFGIDPDEAAVAAATSLGCRAKCATLDDPELPVQAFAHITLSHVIEHVPSPASMLARCFELLAPGGRLWLETPNLESLGHKAFGTAWRGLEAPRHLVLFNHDALRQALLRAGFESVRFLSHPAVPLIIWEASRAIASRRSDSSRACLSRRIMQSRRFAPIADYWSEFRPSAAEFLTCVAYRPAASPES
jgi:2-polyprenyl-3-methyl-5-hydroxy-6-metoxy-1,4-benzoquinol methylase